MLIILKKDVHNLGEAGEVVKVKDGYGRNYLLPNALAIPANDSNVAVLEHQKRIAEAIRKKELAAAKELAEKIGKTAITIRREAGDDEKLFGSVTNRDIAEALAAEDIVVDKKIIALAEPIKAIGLFTVPVKLHKSVTAEIRVFVMKG